MLGKTQNVKQYFFKMKLQTMAMKELDGRQYHLFLYSGKDGGSVRPTGNQDQEKHYFLR